MSTPSYRLRCDASEFGLSVDDSGEAVHVFEGDVTWSPLANRKSSKSIEPGSGIWSDGVKVSKPMGIDALEDMFLFQQQIASEKRLNETGQHQRWCDYIQGLRSREDVVALYDFQPDPSSPHTVMNLRSANNHGSVIGARWSEGRWDGKKAIDFKRPNDRVRFDRVGEFTNISMSVWLRIDGFDREFNSIFLTDRFEEGELHWQVKSRGKVDVGIKQFIDKRQRIIVTPPIFDFEDVGTWHHLVLTIDQDNNVVSNYLDGQLLHQDSFWEDLPDIAPDGQTVPLRLGASELGNWSPTRQYDSWPFRGLNGKIDEFVVFNRALGHQEVAEMYQQGVIEQK